MLTKTLGLLSVHSGADICNICGLKIVQYFSPLLIGYQSRKMWPIFGYFSPRRKSSLFGHIISPLLTKPVRSWWLDIDLVLFSRFYCPLLSQADNQNAKKELGQYPAILTSRLANNAYRSGALPGTQGNNIIRKNIINFATWTCG